MRSTDPAGLTAHERLAEIAHLLATGYWRWIARECDPESDRDSPRDRLAVTRRVEAPCAAHAMSPQNTEGAA